MVSMTFPKLRDDWSLDVVNILAFLGEHNILATSQQVCMSPFCFLPRLIPAPQGLLAQRARTLPTKGDFEVRSVITGNKRPYLNYFADTLHGDGDKLAAYTTRVLHIERDHAHEKRPITRPRLFSPINIIAIFSCAISLGIAAWAVVLGDGPGLAGVLIMSFTTPLLCIGLRWTPQLAPRFRNDSKMQDCIVYRTPRGIFTVVRCDESISRWLYWHPSQVTYLVGSYSGRGVGGIAGGMMLVGSLVLFSNAMWTTKAALVVAYTVLNLLYWLAAIIPPSYSWHFELEMKEELILNKTYTKALWAAIWTSQSVDWVREGDHVPKTEAWNRWIEEARDALHRPMEDFDAQGRLTRLLR
ncbi:hypothetical protein IQ06DRAFT_95808 [Phaeosphaeriaceae sp. SRC1lsM3a]|nr:hypothetical protein IQ06DRAFT_95808 [Stagonospora sp. SRC1lsM3a]